MPIIGNERDVIAFARNLNLEEAALVTDAMAQQNETHAAEYHRSSSKQWGDQAEQTKITAQVLDHCAAECRAIAAAIRDRKGGAA